MIKDLEGKGQEAVAPLLEIVPPVVARPCAPAVLSTSRSGVIEVENGRGKIAYRRGQVLAATFGLFWNLPQ